MVRSGPEGVAIRRGLPTRRVAPFPLEVVVALAHPIGEGDTPARRVLPALPRSPASPPAQTPTPVRLGTRGRAKTGRTATPVPATTGLPSAVVALAPLAGVTRADTLVAPFRRAGPATLVVPPSLRTA